jgi:hypothetical protein
VTAFCSNIYDGLNLCALWLQFIDSLAPAHRRTWSKREAKLEVLWGDTRLRAGTPVRLHDDGSGTLVLDADFTLRGSLKSPISSKRLGLVKARVAVDEDYLEVIYLGPNDLS